MASETPVNSGSFTPILSLNVFSLELFTVHSQHPTNFKLIYPPNIPSKVKKYVTAGELNVDKITRLTWPSGNIINFVSLHTVRCVKEKSGSGTEPMTRGLVSRVIFIIFKEHHSTEEHHSIVNI